MEKNFEQEFETISRQYSPFGDEDCNRLKEQVGKISLILKKMDATYGSKLLRSFEKYERHVKRAAHNVVEDFIFPVPVPGINA